MDKLQMRRMYDVNGIPSENVNDSLVQLVGRPILERSAFRIRVQRGA
jgi:hypothetical protein